MESQRSYFIESMVDRFTIDIDNQQGIYIQLNQETDYIIYITIHDENGNYMGEIRYGYNLFFKSVFLSEYIASINGLILEKGTKSLTFKIYTFSESFQPYHLNLNMTIVPISIIKNSLGDLNELAQHLGFKGKSLPLYTAEDKNYQKALNSGLYKEGCQYYRGDFHGHSNYSDGHIDFSDISRYTKEQKLDFMAMTEHNVVPFVLPNKDCLMIPSFELTLPFGHLNIHGIDQLLILDEPMAQLIRSGNNPEEYPINKLLERYIGVANVSINHMFMEPWDFKMLDLNLLHVNTIEVICDPTYPTASQANDKAIAFIDFLWNKGIHLFGIGGSDCHQTIDERYEAAIYPSVYGDPGTYVYSENLSTTGIIDSVKEGMVYVARFCELDISINQGSILPGQIVNVDQLDYRVMIRPFIEVDTTGWKGFIILDGSVVKSFDLKGDYKCHYQIELNCTEYHWVRFGIIDANKNVICYVNPVYSGQIEVTHYRLKELLEEFNS